MFNSPRCITVASVVSVVPATSLETYKVNAADASMVCQQNVNTMYFKTLNPRLFNLDSDLRLQIFNEFASLVHVGILDGVKKIKFKAFVHELQ